MSDVPRGRRRSRLGRRWARIRRGAENALELLREGRLGAPYRAPFDVAATTPTYTLRRYTRDAPADRARFPSPVLFVPPLMVTAEVYDISPELSATTFLAAHGADVWLVDFGAPEEIEGGLDRTLDDHVLAIDACVDHVVAATGAPVHLVGYSQGGMFCYQAAAYRKSADVRSVVTFGAPVDLRKNLPVKVHGRLVEGAVGAARRLIDGPLAELEGLPGALSSRGFKLLAPASELKHLIGTLGALHDRDALLAAEPKRRFLGGEGFIAWPGPAFRRFVDDFVVHNRMKGGGFVINGRSVSLSDITTPVLAFVGTRDDLARPPAVRAIARVAVRARCHLVDVDAGHFGLVVGASAMASSWPTVRDWLAWCDGAGPEPAALSAPPAAPEAAAPAPRAVGRLYDLAGDVVDGLWQRLGAVGVEASEVISAIRWQLPRVARLASLAPHSRVGLAHTLAEQADAIGDETLLLWRGRAFTYAAADARVDAIAAALHGAGVRRGHHVAALLGDHPDHLTAIAAVNRLGAVVVLSCQPLPPRDTREQEPGRLGVALAAAETDHVIADPEHVALACAAFGPGVFLLGAAAAPTASPPPPDVVDLDRAALAGGPEAPAPAMGGGRADDLAAILVSEAAAEGQAPTLTRVTNGAWVVAGLTVATLGELTPRDTVLAWLPLGRRAADLLVAVGAALVGGARFALAPDVSAAELWPVARNAGATVIVCSPERLDALLAEPAHALDPRHPVRLFIGGPVAEASRAAFVARFGRASLRELLAADLLAADPPAADPPAADPSAAIRDPTP